ncbi:MAG: TPM domain-containing protein [Eubacterium sp.]|nr:TPM domain-containing protein [Eubacterium sp.]
MMKKITSVLTVLLLFISVLCVGSSAEVSAADTALTYTNRETGYSAIVLDNAELLSGTERETLLNDMQALTAYGTVIFSSDYAEGYSTDDYAESVLHSYVDNGDSGMVFEIDMSNRQIYIYSDGYIYDVVTSSYALTITDNVYTYASEGDYYSCAYNAFDQANSLLMGGKISQPMKHINNALMAIGIALAVVFIFVYATGAPGDDTVSRKVKVDGSFTSLAVIPGALHKVYNPPSSSSGGGGGGGGFGGGGGGGSSGGGGGHSF